MSSVVSVMPVSRLPALLARRAAGQRDGGLGALRGDLDPAVAAAERDVGALLEAERVDVELDRAILVGDRDDDGADAAGCGSRWLLTDGLLGVGLTPARDREHPRGTHRRAHSQAPSLTMARPIGSVGGCPDAPSLVLAALSSPSLVAVRRRARAPAPATRCPASVHGAPRAIRLGTVTIPAGTYVLATDAACRAPARVGAPEPLPRRLRRRAPRRLGHRPNQRDRLRQRDRRTRRSRCRRWPPSPTRGGRCPGTFTSSATTASARWACSTSRYTITGRGLYLGRLTNRFAFFLFHDFTGTLHRGRG